MASNTASSRTFIARTRKWVAAFAASALIAGGLVAAGVGAQQAAAAGIAPDVRVTEPSSYIWGEDLPLTLNFTGAAGAGAQYNLSAGVLLPADSTVVSNGTLGTPTSYPAGALLPGATVSGTTPAACADLGLEAAGGTACRVPAGLQYLVYENISDLPEGATSSHTLTVRPKAGSFPIGGSGFRYRVNAYTNSSERFLPVFPGSTGVGSDAAANANTPAQAGTSNGKPVSRTVAVNALRVTKSEETHPENEVLRGVHGDHGAIYQLRIEHTGESDLANAQVVDYLPAGLEYLGSNCAADPALADHTTVANGTGGAEEYENSGPLNTSPVGEGCLREASIETVTLSNAEASELGLGSAAGGVFTKVTWNFGEWLKGNPGGAAQIYSGASAAPGTPAVTTIRYRAGVPLYENVDFGAGAPAPESLQQGANLDNNRGAPTRHGTDDLDARHESDGAGANAYTNAAQARGEYVSGQSRTAVEDADTEQISAVDVRLVKTLNGGEAGAEGVFRQGGMARYRLDIATSEYVRAVQGDPSQRPLRIVDDMADGLCPVFGHGTRIWSADGESASKPKLVLGSYNSGDIQNPDATVAQWNAALAAAGVDPACGWDETEGHSEGAENVDQALSDNAVLVGIAFSPRSGRFMLEYGLGDADALNGPDRNVGIEYTVHQNTAYIKGTDVTEQGATTSRDRFENEAEIELRTTPIDAVKGVGTPGTTADEQARLDADWNAWDDSRAWARAGETSFEKRVLENGALPSRDEVARSAANGGPDPARWVAKAEKPFAVGDQTWYRIVIDPPNGADVRNPVLTDFLPEGVSFDAETLAGSGRYEDLYVVPRRLGNGELPSLGTCAPTDIGSWLDTFVPQTNGGDEHKGSVVLSGNVITMKLGAPGKDCGVGGTDRFLPFGAELDIYLKVTVTEPSAFGEVDMPQNLAKYRQENVDGEIFFDRSDASIVVDRTAKLVKGIAQITRDGTATPAQPNRFGSDVDGLRVAQGDEVGFRLDVTAPYNTTRDYLVYDLLPTGIRAADVKPNAFTAAQVDTGANPPSTIVETPFDAADYEAQVIDYCDPSASGCDYPSNVKNAAALKRSVIVWKLRADVPPSEQPGDAQAERTRGFTLGYTVVVPDGTAEDGGAAALIGQRYENDASIVEFGTANNGGGDSAVIVDGPDNVAIPRIPTEDEPGYAFRDDAGDASDGSDVLLPNVSMSKALVETEIGSTGTVPQDSLNPNNVIVQGELATFDYQVTIPRGTTVRNGVLRDLGNFVGEGGGTIRPSNTFPYVPVSATLPAGAGDNPAMADVNTATGSDPAVDRSRFGLRTDTGKLILPEYYSTGDRDRVFTVRLTVRVNDIDEQHKNDQPSAARPNIPNNKTLRNTAVFESKNREASGFTRQDDDTATVVYREPSLDIAKSAAVAGGSIQKVDSEDTVVYTLRVTNGGVKSYDNTVVDSVPSGIMVQPGSFKVDGLAVDDEDLAFTGDVFAGSSGTITWDFQRIGALAEIPTTAALTYEAKISPSTGAGRDYVNTAKVTGYTLPATIAGEDTRDRRGDRADGASATITATDAAISKDVRRASDSSGAFENSATAPIGDTVEYRVDIALQPNVNYYAPRIVDDLPAGVSLVESSIAGPTVVEGAPALTGEWTRGYDSSANSYTWSYDGDIVSSAAPRTLRLSYSVDLDNRVAQNVHSLPNTAEFTWNQVEGDEATRTGIDDPAEVVVPDPELRLTKDVRPSGTTAWSQRATGEPDQRLDYRIVVRNYGGTAAYESTVTDKVPAGVVVDPQTFRIDGVLAPDAVTVSGDTLTWSIPGGIAVGADRAVTLSYEATFAAANTLASDSAHLSGVFTNTATVTHYESFPRDPSDPGTAKGRTFEPQPTATGVTDTAEAQTRFPYVTSSKSVTSPVGTNQQGDGYGIAEVGEAFGWTLRVTNTGPGAAQTVQAQDLLPANWEYQPGSALVTIPGRPAQQIDPTVTPAGALAKDGQQALVWNFGDADAAEPALPGTATATAEAARTIRITFLAIPNANALETAGTGIVDPANPQHPHTNTLNATATDTRGDAGNRTGGYNGGPDTADAHIAEADLQLDKRAIGGTRDGLYGLADGSWVPGQGVVASEDGEPGYAQPQWRITASNQGPDDSRGPFRIVDTVTAPTGVSTGAWHAVYHPADGSAAVDLGAPSGTGTADDPFIVGDNLLTLDKEGRARIVLTADVSIDEAAVGTAENVADVRGGTYEHPDNLGDNEDDAEQPLAPRADLLIVKSLGNPAAPNSGESITWNLAVRNDGPSDSVSGTEKITVTDTIPSFVNGVTFLANSSWTAALNGQPWGEGAVANAGDTITWTFTGQRIPANTDAATITLTGTIDSSWTPADGAIVNTANVTEGDTPDPDDGNDEDDETTEPTDHTSIGLNKSIVVQNEAGAWVPAQANAFVPGEPISYRMQVVNTGSADARDVVVTDDVPAGLSYRGHVDVDASGTPAPAPGLWTRGALNGDDTFALTGTIAAGTAKYFVVTYDTLPSTSAAVNNCATGDAVNDIVWNAAQQTSCASADRARDADLTIGKTATATRGGDETDAVVAGSFVWYRLVVTNNGPSDASAEIDVEDLLPAGFTYVAGSSEIAGAAAPDPVSSLVDDAGVQRQQLAWGNITRDADLGYQGTVTITFQAAVDAKLRPHAAVNTAHVDGPEDSDESNNDDAATVTVRDETDMSIVKTVADGPYIAGTDVSYTLTVTNTGTSAAPADVTDTLPDGLTVVDMQGAGWSCDAPAGGRVGSCDYTGDGGLHPVGTSTITVVAHIAPNAAELAQPLKNTAVLTWTDSDEDSPHTDEDDADITVTRIADLGIEKLALDRNGVETATAVAGTSLWYSLDVRNEGPSDAVAPLVVHDRLPAGASFAGLSSSAAESWSAEVDPDDPQHIVFTRTPATGILLDGRAPKIVFEVQLAANLPVQDAEGDPTVLRNVAEIDGATLESNGDPVDDADEAPDSDEADVTISRRIDLGIEKSHDAAKVRIGDELPFVLDVTNHGPSEATGIAVTDTVPAGLEVVDEPGAVLDAEGRPTGWTIDSITLANQGSPAGGATIAASYDSPLAPGEQAAPLTLNTLVTAAAYDAVTNVAEVRGTEPEPDPDTEHPNRDEDRVTVPPLATLDVEKISVGEFKVGETGTYRITVTNSGPTPDPGPITVTDELPDGLSFRSSPDEGVMVSGRTVAWTLEGGLGVGETATLTLVVNVGQAAYPSVTNTVTVGSSTELTPESTLSDDDTVGVVAADPLAVTGQDLAALAAMAALLLLLAGAATMLRSRRRRETAAE